MQVIDEDHYTPQVIYGAGSYTFTREMIGTRYVSLGVRILVDPTDPEDMKQVHSAGWSGTVRSAQLGSGKPEEGAGRF
jgi:hypothetical protein